MQRLPAVKQMGRSIYLLFFLLCSTVLITVIADARADMRQPVERFVQYSFDIRNTTGRVVRDIEFETFAPVKQTASQRFESLEVSHPYELFTDELGNQIINIRFEAIPPYGTEIVRIKARLTMSAKSPEVPDYGPDRYLLPGQFVESDNPKITRMAERFAANDPMATATSIFKWVSGNIKYAGYIGREKGALAALRDKSGDCTEYMDLFAALGRANNIPVRRIGGYICSKNCILQPAGFHNWNEFYADQAWHPADPQNKIFMKNQADYIAMQIIPESADNPMSGFNRFRIRGKGVEVRMNN